jgi:hypothetical protein
MAFLARDVPLYPDAVNAHLALDRPPAAARLDASVAAEAAAIRGLGAGADPARIPEVAALVDLRLTLLEAAVRVGLEDLCRGAARDASRPGT